MQLNRRFLTGSFAMMCFVGSLGLTANVEEQKIPDLTQMIAGVRANVASLHRKLPDFVCQEEILRRDIKGNETTKETRYLLSLQATHNPHDAANQFLESRDVISITTNGKDEKIRKYSPPIGLRGGFARDLFTFFDDPATSCFDFKPAITDEAKDRGIAVLDVSLNKNDGLQACKHIPADLSTARVWVDTHSLQVIRIQERTMHELEYSQPFAHTNGTYSFSPVIEFGAVKIHAVNYWLPRSKSVTFVKTKGSYSISYSAQYTDYHQFATSITIRTQQETN